MTSRNLGNVVDYLRRIVNPFPATASDHYLLAHFLSSRDEAAFAALLKRHGPMVFGVSRRVLSRVHDAEDVVQATFLLLARKAGTIRPRASVGCWLHGVARRLSIQLKRREMARLKRDTRASATRAHAENPHVGAPEIQELLDTALQELPEKYRAALVICYLEGQTQEEAARQLGCPLGTVRSRLARGRALLQKNLTRRGLTLSAGGLAALMMAQAVSARLPTKLFAATVHAAAQYAAGTPLRVLVSASVAWLVQSGLKSVALTKLVWVSVGLVTMGVLAGGAGLAARHAQAKGADAVQVKQETKGQSQPISKAAEAAVEKPRTDLFGDPLPPGALVRLGTTRLRHGDQVRLLNFFPDGKTLLSADWHGVHIWDATTGRHLRRFGGPHGRQFQDMAATSDNNLVALTMSDGDVEIWDANIGRQLRQFHVGRFPGVVFSPDGNTLAVLDLGTLANEAQSLRLFDASNGAELHRLGGHKDRIQSVIFSKDGKTLVTSSDDQSIRFWDVGTGKQVRQLDHSTLVGTIALAPDGKTLASLEMTKSEYKRKDRESILWLSGSQIVIWDVATNRVTHRLDHPGFEADKPWGNQVNAIAFSPDGKTLLSSDRLGTHFWDFANGKQLPMRDLPTVSGIATAFTPDGKTLATGGSEVIQLWDLVSGKEKLPLGGHQGSIREVAISSDGHTVATGGGSEKLIRLWDSTSGEQTGQLAAHDYGVSGLAFVPDGRLLISSGVDALTQLDGIIKSESTVRVWDLSTSKEIQRISGSSFALSPDGRSLVADSQDKFLHVWEIATGLEIRKWPTTQGKAMAFSPDGRMLFRYDANNKVQFWEIATGKERRNFEGHHFRQDSHDFVGPVAFSPNGKLVAFAGNGNYIALYDMATGKQNGLLHGHSDVYAFSLAFSTDSRLLASSANGTLRLWEIATGEEFLQLAGHKGRFSSIAFSTNNKLLITGNDDTTALVWDLTGAQTGAKPQPLTAHDQEAACSDLSAADAVRGQKAVRTLLAAPDQAVALLAKKLKPVVTPDAKVLARCLANLDSDLFKTREEAMRELENMGDVAAPALRTALTGTPSLELKNRLESLLEKFATSQRLRTLRAVQVLEQVGTSSSRALLAQLAEGGDALLTREAKGAVERLAKVQMASGGR